MATEHVDVLIVGAGLSGIGAACHLQAECPGKSYAILESRGAIGGTWDLFRYPGVRSDSDMFTLGYAFRPWTDSTAIADGPSIRRYIEETASEHGVRDKIRFHHQVVSAAWSSEDARWTVTARRSDTGETVEITCSWLSVCAGYYRYDEGFRPRFEGEERFAGRFVHPQHWPEDLDLTGRRVVVIGSGATAVTLVPSLAEDAEHVTMLQRTPSYVLSLPGRDPLAQALRTRLPARIAYPVVRWKNVLTSTAFYQFSRRWPAAARRVLRRMTQKQLPGIDVDTHFNPPYDPWDQRLCLVPDGDLFTAIREGRASVVTDRIEGFTENGVRLASGAELTADVVVTATGLRLLALGGVRLVVDGHEVAVPETMAYRGMMLSGVPNFAFTIGYTNASWTLKADLVAEFVVRLLRHMDARGYDRCVPVNDDPSVTETPLLDFQAGYVLRSIDEFPKAGSRTPWRLGMSYAHDLIRLRYGRVDDGALRFSRRPAPRRTAPRSA
jgi:monooxygenase